jgi:[ribosomal protein S18]-alanine N-acetyltransferase
MSAGAAPAACALRRATWDDLAAVSALEYACFDSIDAFPPGAWRHLLGPAAQRGSAITLVAEEGRDLLAAITGLLRSNTRVLRLYSLAVDARQRGRGLGRRLIAALVAAAPPRCDTLSLEVRVANAPARHLYESLGMRVVGELPDYYPDGAPGLRYRAPFAALALAR